MSNKDMEKTPITINIESLSFHFGDCHSNTFYNTDMDEKLEVEFEDDGGDEDEAETEDACECECCKDEKKPDGVKHISEMPEKDREFLKLILGSVLEELK